MKAFIAAVVKRSNSRNCGDTRDEVVTKASGYTSRTISARALLVRRVEVGEEKADRDRLDAPRP